MTTAVLEDSAACTVVSVRLDGSEGIELRYVHNKLAPVGEHTLADYDAFYLEQTGSTCASAASNGNPATVGPTARR